MTDTSPTPADQLRAAAGHAPSPELARLLETLADASDHHALGEGGAVATVVHPALAVARRILGTSTAQDTAADEPSADRRARYAAAIRETDGWVLDDGQHMIDAVMAVADAEQASLRAEAEGLDDALRGAISASEKAVARLRAELAAAPPAPADRAATRDRIRRAICEASGFDWLPDELMEPDEYGEHADAVLAVLAGEAAAGAHQTTTTADKAAALGMTPTEYRQHSHNTAVQQIRAASQGLFAGTAIRVTDALDEPPAKACRARGAGPMTDHGYTGISLAGRWECGTCGASGDGWWDEEDGLRLDEDHECEETTR